MFKLILFLIVQLVVPLFASLHNNIHNGISPLILTPYITSGRIDEGQEASRVKNLNTTVVSYSGYFTVNSSCEANMYFWFFPSKFNTENSPLIIWLQGGPGASSLLGLFTENGPFIIDANNNMKFRSTSWSLTANVLYFDQPVGTGFSFTKKDECYATNEEDVSRDLYSAISQFLTLFPKFQSRNLFITGESYGGKYVPAISLKIHKENNKAQNKLKINLKGLAIGNGISDPENMFNFGEYLYNVGLIDYYQMQHFQKQEEAARVHVRNKQWLSALDIMEDLIFEFDKSKPPSYFRNCSGFDKFYYNILMSSEPPEQTYYKKFVQLAHVRKEIHVGNQTFSDGSTVSFHLRQDILQSVANILTELLDAKEKYRVIIYSGQLDIIVATRNTDEFLRKLKWHGQEELVKSQRKIWKASGQKQPSGYVKVADNLSFLIVRNAGHILPYDQPKNAFDMINRFISGKPFA